MGKGRGITVCPNDDGTVKQSGSEVEMDYTPEMVEDSEAFSLSEKNFMRDMFRHAKPSTATGSCSL